MWRFVLMLALSLPAIAGAAPNCPWPAWERLRTELVSVDGRVLDPSDERLITTSEGQSYGLFFALVANDRATFAQLLRWTSNNLAEGLSEGIGNMTSITQAGMYNITAINQVGSDNQATVTQSSLNMNANVNQTGTGNVAFVSQQ